MKLDEAVMRMRELERTLAKTAAEHATVAQRCGVLQDTVRGTEGGQGATKPHTLTLAMHIALMYHRWTGFAWLERRLDEGTKPRQVGTHPGSRR